MGNLDSLVELDSFVQFKKFIKDFIINNDDLFRLIYFPMFDPFSEDYVILKIDISKLNITYWWDDASGGETVYTIESIPPKFIKVIGNVMNFDSQKL